jgi:1,4-alpha-glucan branching enzyme
MAPRGSLSLLLHTHMPYVEGFGTWPFGEEWLWEAIATSYLPLLDVLDAWPGRVTLGVTPVLADQLEAPGALARCEAFLREVRPESHRLDLEATGDPGVASALERSAVRYAWAAERVAGVGTRLMDHASWTSAATHPVLPLLATPEGIALQLETGIAAHRSRRGGEWEGGLWLPECAHAPWLDPLLEAAGVRTACVELTDVFGAGAREQLRPLRSAAGPLLVPIDRAVIDLVWAPDGYPSAAPYRDSHRLTERRHQPWANDGAPYDADRAAEQARAHAADFVERALERVRGGGLCVCALDTELLGHWWHEGIDWLAAVLEAAEARGLPVVPLDAAVAEAGEAAAPEELPVTTWGTPRDLSTWSGPRARGLAWRQRAAELRTLHARDPGPRAARELMALQASDWAFLLTREMAGDYPLQRVAGHERELARALSGNGPPGLRNLAARLWEPGVRPMGS